MKRQAILCVALFVAYVALLGECRRRWRQGEVNAPNCGQYTTAPKSGATYDATPGDFPSFVEVLVPVVDSKTHRVRTVSCGGTIIGERAVLTAAHCFVHEGKKYDKARVVVSSGSGKFEEIVSAQVCAEGRDSSLGRPMEGDFAIVELNRRLDLGPNSTIKRACFGNRNFDSASQLYAIGFKEQRSGHSTSVQVTPVRNIPCPSSIDSN